MNWNEAMRRILAELDSRVDAIVAPMREIARPIIVPYRGYGTNRKVWLRGRVIDDPTIEQDHDPRPILGHTREMWRRFASHEISGARIEISIGSQAVEATSDGEGYFDLEVELGPDLDSASLWHPYQARLIEPSPGDSRGVFEGSVLIPPDTATLGIISDIDDTIIDSSATDSLQMLRTLLFTAAESRLPFEGISELFEALIRSDDRRNPVFYVSSSPWNLYDFLVDLMEIHDLPAGPMMLQDFGLDETRLIHAPHDEHKLAQISRIIGTYPGLEWILIGDSGQRDPEIYRAVAEEVPDQIRAIIIRDVTSATRDQEIRAILEPLETRDLPVALVESARDARTLLETARLLDPGEGEILP